MPGTTQRVAVSLPHGRAVRPRVHRRPLQYRDYPFRIGPQCRSTYCVSSGVDPGSWARTGTWEYRRPSRAVWLAHRCRVGKPHGDQPGTGPTLLADQSRSGTARAGPLRRGRGMLSQGVGDAAGLCCRSWQSAVCPQLPDGRHRGSSLRRVRCLGSSPCQAPGADDAELHVGSDTRSPTSRWIRLSRLPPARGCNVRGTIDRCARQIDGGTLSLFGRRRRGRRDRPLSFAQRPLAQHDRPHRRRTIRAYIQRQD